MSDNDFQHTQTPSLLQPPSADLGGAQTDAERAVDEVNLAAAQAESALGEKAVVVRDPVANDLEARQRSAKFYADRVLRQKKRGQDALSKTVTGAMSVKRDLVIYDLTVASSVERFTGMVDNAIYTFNRRGEAIMGHAKTQSIIERLEEMIGDYAAKAREAQETSSALMDMEKEKTLDWLEPQYENVALEVTTYVKSPVILRLLNGVADWEKAIHNLTTLGWNGKVQMGQSAELRETERKAHAAIFNFAARSLVGLRKEMDKGAQGSKKVAEVPASPQNNDAGADNENAAQPA